MATVEANTPLWKSRKGITAEAKAMAVEMDRKG